MGILQTDALVLDQVRSVMSNDFGIHDLAGAPIGRIVTEGGMGSRLLMGNRQLAIVDTDGTLLVRVVDPPGIGLDRYEVHDGQGQVVARIVKEFTFFTKALRIELATGPQLRLEGSMWDREFQVTGPGGLAATASRHWPGVAQAFGAQSVPMVVAVAAGRAVTAFAGAQPEPAARQWLDDVLAQLPPEFGGGGGAATGEAPSDPRRDAAEQLAADGDYEGARAAYEAILHANPGDAEAAAAVKQMAFFARATRGEPGAIDRADAATGATGEEKVALALAAADEELLTGSPKGAFELRNQAIKPYSDLLLHDMGEGLADHRPEARADGREWRTAPLWGIALNGKVTGVEPSCCRPIFSPISGAASFMARSRSTPHRVRCSPLSFSSVTK